MPDVFLLGKCEYIPFYSHHQDGQQAAVIDFLNYFCVRTAAVNFKEISPFT